MTLAEYANTIVAQLSDCRSVAEFQTVLDDAVGVLEKSSIGEQERSWFWAQVQASYKKAPKIVLKEAAAAEKLFVLMQAAEAMLASAATK